MTSPTEPDGLTAVLLQLAGVTDKLAALEHRQAGDARQVHGQVAALSRAVDDMQATVTRHGQAMAALDGLDQLVAELAGRVAGLTPGRAPDGPGYRPGRAPRIWKLDGPARDEAIGRLRGWVDQVYRPGYGHLSASLGDCWDQHPLCLYVLDWLSELWSVLYLQPARTDGTLAGQAEWHTRLLPAAAGQLARETRGCQHHPAAGNGLPLQVRGRQ